MAVGGEAPWALGVMWTLTAIAATFVALRLYTRVVVIDSFGTDDAVYSVAFVCCMACLLYKLFGGLSWLTSCHSLGPPRFIHNLHVDCRAFRVRSRYMERATRPYIHSRLVGVYRSDLRRARHGRGQDVAGLLLPAHRPRSVAAHPHLGRHASSSACFPDMLTVLLAPLRALSLLVGSFHPRRSLWLAALTKRVCASGGLHPYRFLLRHLPVAHYVGLYDEQAREICHSWKHESWYNVSSTSALPQDKGRLWFTN